MLGEPTQRDTKTLSSRKNRRLELRDLLLVILFTGLYIGAYLALADHQKVGIVNLGVYFEGRMPNYRVNNPAIEIVFMPAQWIDERIRPNFWRSEEVPGPPGREVGGFL